MVDNSSFVDAYCGRDFAPITAAFEKTGENFLRSVLQAATARLFPFNQPVPLYGAPRGLRPGAACGLLLQLLDALHSLHGLLGIAEGGQAEIALAVLAEALAGGAYDFRVVEQVVKVLPRAHAAGAL